MKKMIVAALLLMTLCTYAQSTLTPTEQISIEGRVKKPVTVSLKDLSGLKTYALDSLTITNHLGEFKNSVAGLRGVLIRDVLARVEYDAESPKLLSEYYFTFTASDGYKCVFSWNELYNTATGDHAYLITEGYGTSSLKNEQRIAMVVPTDFKTGRRYLKALATIKVNRVP